jgi:hypothetical protein
VSRFFGCGPTAIFGVHSVPFACFQGRIRLLGGELIAPSTEILCGNVNEVGVDDKILQDTVCGALHGGVF